MHEQTRVIICLCQDEKAAITKLGAGSKIGVKFQGPPGPLEKKF